MQTGIELSFAVLPEAAALLQPGERPLRHPSFRQYHEGVQFVAFDHFHRGSQQALHRRGKGFPGVYPPSTSTFCTWLRPSRYWSNIDKAQPGRCVGCGHMNPMGQSIRVHRDVALDSGHLLARVIAFDPGAVQAPQNTPLDNCPIPNVELSNRRGSCPGIRLLAAM